MNRILLDLGFVKIYWYSICILLGALLASILFYWEAKKKKIPMEFVKNLIFYTIIVGLIGARIYYVIFNLDYYLYNPLEILAVYNGGLAIHGGIIAGIIFIVYYCRKYHQNPLLMTDMIAPGIIIAQAIGRWGNFFNQEAYGMITTRNALEGQLIPEYIIDNMYIAGEFRQPTFYYESLWNILGFLLIIIIRQYLEKIPIGVLTSIYLIWYSLGRIFIEALRSDSLMLGSIKVAQLVSVLLINIGILLLIGNRKKEKYNEI